MAPLEFNDLKAIFCLFRHAEEGSRVVSIRQFGSGHINETYKVTIVCVPNGEASADMKHREEKHFIMQRINGKVFSQPERLMENFARVTEA